MTNNAVIIGNITRDLELKTTGSGVSYVKFTVAVTRKFGSQQTGEKQTDFIPVTAWRQLAELCARYLHKGSKCCVMGPIHSNSYETADGQKRTSIEIAANEVEFLERPMGQGQGMAGGGSSGAGLPAGDQAFDASGFVPVDDDDLPF